MYKPNFYKREVFVFRRFGRKGYSLFACLGREVVISTLSAFTLTHATAKGVSIKPIKADTIAAATDREMILGEVSVTGTRAPLASGRTVRMVRVLTKADIAAAPAQSVNDLLKLAVGVDVRQRGPIGAQTDVSIRGGNYEQIAILLNGVNICDPQTGHNAFDFPVDISEIERIEVLEGPAGRVYGTSSLSGAINIVTSSPMRTSAYARAEGGSYGYASAAVRLALSGGNAGNSISGSYTRSDGYSRNKAGGLNADYSGGKAFYQGAYAGDGIAVRWHAGMSIKDCGANTFYGVSSDDQFEHTMKTYTALQAEARAGAFRLRSSIYWNHGADRFEYFRGSEVKSPFNYHRSDVFGVSVGGYFDSPLGRTSVGAELRNEDVVSTKLGEPLSRPHHIHGTDRDYKYGLNRTNVNLMLEHNVVWRGLTVSAGLVAAKNSWNDMNMRVYPGVDISYAIGRSLTVFASCNTSLRMPSVTELYYSVDGHKADKYLKPEELTAFEGGVRYASGAVQAEASVYHNRYKNMIDWVRHTSDGPDASWESVNFTRINALGVEASLRLGLDRLMPSQHVLRSLAVSYGYIDQDKANTDGLENKYSLEYLRHKLVASLGVSVRRNVSLELSCRWQDRTGIYTDTGGMKQSYSPYAVADARLEWLVRPCKMYVEANNLLNTTYVDYGNVPQPGFWFVAGASVEL